MNHRSLHAVVRGRVQGVGFRYFVARRAHDLGLTGYARNLADGTVEVYAEGAATALETLARDLERGPGGAGVTRVDTRYGESRGDHTDFHIR